ncbi:hypothetical protein GCM10011575_19630 [Microlunatus endophyticus]|uniref:Bacterial Ig-like domain-containing protein n=2 Tax=Microlunatus endophyticus TaxID=1716077 RepID=A0A917S631_9ACTN|nr:hypothetical protein GCM10011575_19630 [Microlunatus endophyticus]
MSARLVLDRHTARPGDEVAHMIINDADRPLEFGLGYGLEQHTADGWVEIPVLDVFAAVGLGVDPGMTSRAMTMTVPGDLEPGRYRISKQIWVDQADDRPFRDREECICAEFTVEA